MFTQLSHGTVAIGLRMAAMLLAIAGSGVRGPRDLGAQQLPIPQGSSEAQIVGAAEADGACYPRAQPIAGSDAPLRTCAAGHERGPVSSGEFTIGGNLAGSASLRAGKEGKVWWAPRHHAADMHPLVVRGRSLTTPTDSMRFTTADIAWPVEPGAAPVPPAERKHFFPSGISVPRPGRWLMVATSGPNWGCFIVEVRP